MGRAGQGVAEDQCGANQSMRVPALDVKLDLIGETLRHLTVLYKCKLEIALGLGYLGKNK